jgi:hypothetical protein
VARSSPARLALDLGCAGAALVILVGLLSGSPDEAPPMPDGVRFAAAEEAAARAPRYQALARGGRITVAALFGRMTPGPVELDYGTLSYRAFRATLEGRGYRLARVDEAHDAVTYAGEADGVRVMVDVLGPRGLPLEWGAAIVGARLGRAIGDHDIIYYDGHAFEGELSGLRRALPGYRILVVDACWSLQHYGLALGGVGDVVTNRERSITGSVESFSALLDELLEGIGTTHPPSWATLLDGMNRRSAERAAERVRLSAPSELQASESYGLTVASGGPR